MPSVRRDGLEIHYEVTGAGHPVLLAHSLLCSGAMWAAQVPALAQRHRVLNVDARGHGASGHATRRFTMYDSMADHLAVLDALGLDRAVWVGLSQGGMAALRAALEYPERVAGLVLIDTDAGPENAATRARERALAVFARVIGTKPVLPAIVKLMFGETTRRENPQLVAEWSRRFEAVDVRSIANALGAVSGRDDLFPRLSRIAAPSVVLAGTEDAALPIERSRRLAAAVPGARLVEIPRAGHLSALEQPDLVTAEILKFLDALDWNLDRHPPSPRSMGPTTLPGA